VHIKAITKGHPAPAQNLEVILDLFAQVLSVLRSVELLLGLELECFIKECPEDNG